MLLSQGNGGMDMIVSIVGYVTEFTIQKDAFKSM